MCSWPPEDDRIESFQRHVRDQARAILGADLARSEKFTSSVMDGLDIRETLRNWHTGDLYVKVLPPSRGTIEIVVFLFDVPADPQVYTTGRPGTPSIPEESTLAFFGTDALKNLVGPGIAQAEYGGAMFLYPPRPIPDIWDDPGSTSPTPSKSASWPPPSSTAASEARRRGLPQAPLGRLAAAGPQVRQEDRPPAPRPVRRPARRAAPPRFHVLNGKEVRSYAADFIRDL